jgi:predicted ATPase/class 3 adenylate cyclase
MPDLPTGTVTFLFTDIEGSTQLLEELGEGFRALQDAHSAIVRGAVSQHGGVEIRTEGDSFFVVFEAPGAAVRAVVDAQRGLDRHRWPQGRALRVRMGMHTGHGVLGGGDYLGLDVNRAARIAALGWGGQVVISDALRGLVEHDLPEGVAIRSLGVHRLKDLSHPEHLFDVVIEGLPSEFPPIRTLEVPINLPTPLTSFVGREDEIARARALLAESRLITLTGSGGTGKTRLGVQVAAAAAAEFPDGVFFVDLSPVSDPVLVVPTIAAALGLREEGWERPVNEVLENYLRERQMLLVLDNFEQVLDAAGEVRRLLAVSPRSKILVTSRRPLHLRGEQSVPVAPLPVPDTGRPLHVDDVDRSAAVRLFVDRATAVDPDFALTEDNASQVAEICARLDGLPLAIELAASRVALLGPATMLRGMERRLPLLTSGPRDLPARQRTLRAVVGWSYELVAEADRVLFRRLSTLAGGWTLASASAVCDPDGAGIDVLEGIASLLDASLVHRTTASGEQRFDMLQIVREFGLERLEAEDDRTAIERRHARWFLGLAEEAERHFRGPGLERWLRSLEVEHDNLRAALRWTLEEDDAEIGLCLAASLWRLWHLGGYLSEGRHWTSAVLALPSASERTLARARALTALGGLAYWQNDVPAVRSSYEEALAIARELGDRPMIADGTYNFAFSPGLEGDRESARTLFRQSMEMFQRLGDSRGEADSMWALSLIARLDGDLPGSLSYAEGSVRRHRALGDVFGLVDSLHELGRAAYEMGDLETARASFLESLEILGPLGYRTGIAIVLDNLAAQELSGGRLVRALRLRGASEGLKESSGGRPPAEFVDLPDPRGTLRGTMSEQQIVDEWERGKAMSLDEVLAYASLEEP